MSKKKQTTMFASVGAVALLGATLLLSGVLNRAAAQETTSPFSSSPNAIGTATKIVVQIDGPYGHEILRSFKVFQTDNLMQKNGYYTLRLQGQIMNDKLTLIPWIANEIGKMSDGMAADGVSIEPGSAAKLTEPKEGEKIDTPVTGKVTVQLLEADQDAFGDGLSTKPVRQIEYSGCHVAGYYMGTLVDNVKGYFVEGIQHYEEVVFACKKVENLDSSNKNNRGILVERSIQGSSGSKTNEKGELITTREYRQPIVMEASKNVGSNHTKHEITTRMLTDKTNYKIGDTARFTLTFTDLAGNSIEPDTIKAYYNSKMVVLKKQDVGIYTFTTPPLLKEHQQLIVSVEKKDFGTYTRYLSIPVHRIG